MEVSIVVKDSTEAVNTESRNSIKYLYETEVYQVKGKRQNIPVSPTTCSYGLNKQIKQLGLARRNLEISQR